MGRRRRLPQRPRPRAPVAPDTTDSPAALGFRFLVIVRRGREDRFRRLETTFRGDAMELRWDRRLEERRQTLNRRHVRERRRGERRRPPPATWARLDIIVVRRGAPAGA